MIVWLASYPRSGNTLLRTILKRCFDLCSYEDVPIDRPGEFRDNPDMIGHLEKQEAWDDFYAKALASPELFLVKTHLPPRDEQPFIYAVRDGRLSVTSYRKFHRDYNNLDKSIISLIIGDDVCGDWTSHYRIWNDRPAANKLVLKFEDLVNISDETLARIARFINFKGNIKPWENPIAACVPWSPTFSTVRIPVSKPTGMGACRAVPVRKISRRPDAPARVWGRPVLRPPWSGNVPREFLDMAEEMGALIQRLALEHHERLTRIHHLERQLNRERDRSMTRRSSAGRVEEGQSSCFL